MKIKKFILWIMICLMGVLPSAEIFAQDAPPRLFLPSISIDPGSTSAPAAQIAMQDPNSPLNIALAFVREHRAAWGLSESDLADIVVKDYYTTRHNGVTHVYLYQRLQGIEVFNGVFQINVAADNSILNSHNQFVPNLAAVANSVRPSIPPGTAVAEAAQHLGIAFTRSVDVVATLGGSASEVLLSDGGISRGAIPAKLVFERNKDDNKDDNSVRLAWNVSIERKDIPSWRHLRVDAVTGEILSENDWVADASYRVFAQPLVNPEDGGGLPGSHTLAVDPSDAVASPFGWHDTNGAAGAEYTDTRGNNVLAQEDTNADNVAGFRPTERTLGLLDFDYAFDPSLAPTGGTNQQAAIVNLFYQNNIIHDILYHYGFDEVSGNFQMDNYGQGGIGNDAVLADAQDGSGTNNANFAFTPDGFSPRMQMYLFDTTTPWRDSAMDNGVIVHEYGHGLSTRLTGGPSNPACLFVDEQMGEGWSDFLALVLTAKAGDSAAQPRGLGNYVLNQGPDGPGFRPYPYSTDMGINLHTYDAIQRATIPHGVGAVWAEMLWEMYWGLVKQHGFDGNLYTGTGGNNLALQLVVDGMKLQPCNPGFVDGRDAILLADQVNYGGANQCIIWEAFAKRGLGIGASQGSSDDVFDGTESYEIPATCQPQLSVGASASSAYPGKVLMYTLTLTNTTPSPLTGVVMTNAVPTGTTYVAGSASDSGSETGGVVSWNLGTMQPGDVRVRTFHTQVNLDRPLHQVLLSDDLENGGAGWTPTGLWHVEDGTGNCSNSHSPTTSWYYGKADGCNFDTGVGVVNFGSVKTETPILLPPGESITLRFWSWEEKQAETWADQRWVGIQEGDGHSETVWQSVNNSATWYEASADLSAHAGKKVSLYFAFNTFDGYNNHYRGWYVDDITLTSTFSLFNQASATSDQGKGDSAQAQTYLAPISSPPTPGNDSAGTNEDTPVAIDVLANDTDPNSNALIVASVTQPAHGSVTNHGTNVTYTPHENYHGSDTFTYLADNGITGVATGTVTITVNPVDDGPEAVTINGPSSGVVGQEYRFEAVTTIAVQSTVVQSIVVQSVDQGVAPSAVLPLLYTWEATDHPASEQSGDVSTTKSFMWATPGTKHISLTVANQAGQTTTQVSIAIAAGEPSTVVLAATPSRLPADGASTSAIVATVRDASGTPLSNQQVDFTTTLGTITVSALTDANGVAQATLTSSITTGVATISAQAGSASDTAQVEFSGGTIVGAIFHDPNLNGRQDSGEAGIAGVEVTVTPVAQAGVLHARRVEGPLQSVMSDAAGRYSINNLPFGHYRVDLRLPGGYSFTTLGSFVVELGSLESLSSVAIPDVGISRLMFVPTVLR